jgi:exodeoxyribonuclease V alpha subunit
MHKIAPNTSQAVELENISGVIERITFYNQDNGFFVIKLQPSAKINKLITVIGSSGNITIGEYANCYGNWIKDKVHGIQFQAKEIILTKPNTIAGIEKYLGSGLIKGVGPFFAKKLVAAFGTEVFEIIDNNPEKLLTMPGIGSRRYEQITTAWSEQKQIRKIIMFLHEHGIGTARAIRIYKTYKEQAIEKIKDNPYRLALDIHGIGFKTADNLAISLGIPKDSIIRAEAGVRFVLQQLINTGNCGIDLQQLVSATEEHLEISANIIIAAIEREIVAERLIIEDNNLGLIQAAEFIQITLDQYQNYLVFSKYVYNSEKYLAKQILLLGKDKPAWHNTIAIEQEITAMEQYAKIKFSNSQHLAITTAVQNKLVIVTGGPGVGKTTVARSILHLIAAKTNKILLCAPTGKAAKRLTESTNMPATTLHRMLAFDPKTRRFKYNQDNLLDVKLVLVDEVSMIDLLMFASLLKALPLDCSLILMGDVDQLPSVGLGAVLADLIRSDCVRFVVLREIFRQSSNSKIVINAHRINQGNLPVLENTPDTDFYFIKLSDINLLPDKILQIVDRLQAKFAFNLNKDIQILSPMNKGIAGVGSLNSLLQKKINPNANNNKLKITKFGNEFIVGDKIIQTVNNYDKEVFNGDLGTIDSINLEDAKLIIKFDERLIDYDFDELDEISLAYAVTIHKSQGSEYPVVIVPISMQHYSLLQKNLIYTAVTRGKSLVVLVGEIKALAIAVKNTSKGRITRLTERLMANIAT